jgi:hypothetical protein
MQFYIPGLYTQDGSGPASAWDIDIHLPGSSQMQLIRRAILDRSNKTHFSRVPVQDIVVGDAGTNDKRVTATRDRGGRWIMVYSPTGEPLSVETGG